jgi:DNA-binding NarL/FixJ family response regulator
MDASPIRVLLVDDVADLRLVVRKALEQVPEFEVVGEAADGAAAIEAAAATAPDLIVLDLSMPGVDGFEALPRLRQVAPRSQVVVLSGLPPRGAERRARSAGAVGFLEKGIPSRQLVGELLTIAALVEAVGAPAAEERVHLDREPTAPRAARRFVDETLRRWDCGDAIETIELLVSELVTNAFLHAESVADVAIILRADAIRVEVGDDSPTPPRPRQAKDHEPSGRGLALVESLSSAWGVEVYENGKVVWFEVPRFEAAASGR